MIQILARDIENCNLKRLHKGPHLKERLSTYIGWKLSQLEWIKLNSECVCKDKGALPSEVVSFAIQMGDG
jgi:hypothetical protein